MTGAARRVELERTAALRPRDLLAALLFAAGCSVDPATGPTVLVAHCIDELGDQTCRARFSTRPYCDKCRPASEHQGCASSPPQTPACKPDPTPSTSSPTTVGATDSSDSMEDPTTGTGSTTMMEEPNESSTTIIDAVCVAPSGSLDEGCLADDPGRPFCVAGACVSCVEAGGDAFCRGSDATAPACDTVAGTCLACNEAPEAFDCGDATPVCGVSGACLRCRAHSECPGTACHLDPSDPLWGRCFEPSERMWVDNSEVCPGEGTQASPDCSLTSALASVSDGDNVVIFLAGGGTAYEENPVLAVDAAVAILGASGPRIVGDDDDRDPTFEVEDGFLYLHGLRIVDNGFDFGLTCQDATVWAQRSEFARNDRYGIYLRGPCDLRVENSIIHNNRTGGLRQFGGRLTLHNTAVGLNGDGSSGPGVFAQLAQVDILYSTIVANSGTGTADNLNCINATGTVRNSAIVGTTLNSVGLGCIAVDPANPLLFVRNAIDTSNFVGSEGRLVNVTYNPAWFVNPSAGDFRLALPQNTPFGDVALWQEGDPRFDADGTPRPQGDINGYVGVDEP